VNILTLSSSEEKPKKEFDLTSFKHLAHLCRACLVKLTRKGIKIIERKPNNRIENIATRYPKRLVRYSTIEYETASQNGHLTFVDLRLNK
jgi:hypothetical protein